MTVEPLPFIVNALDGMAPGALIDIACGRGRHVALALSRGFLVTGVDRDPAALSAVPSGARILQRDVEKDGLPGDSTRAFDVAITTFFLYRPLLPDIFRVLRPGGVWLMETFHVENHLRRQHPGRREFAWEQGEAARLAELAGFRIISVDEGEHGGVYTTQLVAQVPDSAR